MYALKGWAKKTKIGLVNSRVSTLANTLYTFVVFSPEKPLDHFLASSP